MAEEIVKITPIEGIDIEGNYETFKHMLLETQRDGIASFLLWLDTTDFKTAPASSRFHCSFMGGLCVHSMNVVNYATIISKSLDEKIPEDSIVIAAALHDLCKTNFYKIGKVWDKEYKDKFNKWREKEAWVVEEDFPVGHGEKSLALAMRYLSLTKAEGAAIRWHMSSWEQGVHTDPTISKPFRESLDRWPLVKLIIVADQWAELQETCKKSYGPMQESLFEV